MIDSFESWLKQTMMLIGPQLEADERLDALFDERERLVNRLKEIDRQLFGTDFDDNNVHGDN